MNPSKRKVTVLKQISKLIPRNMIPKLASKHGVDKQSRSFTPWSHVLSLMYAQLSHAMSLNDVCDAISNHSGAFKDIREASLPSRNGLSHANRNRNPEMAEDLFWSVFRELKKNTPGFGLNSGGGVPHRFKRTINAVDSSTISLFANCLDWAKHRRRKAAAKMHLRLDLRSFLFLPNPSSWTFSPTVLYLMVTQSAPWGGLLVCLYITSGRSTSILFTALNLSLNSELHSEHTLAYNGGGMVSKGLRAFFLSSYN